MLFTEHKMEDIETIVESVGDSKKTYLRGIFMEAEEKNRNGRVYDLAEMKAQVAMVNKRIEEGDYVLGELDHPNNLTVSLRNVSHKIVSMHMEGNRVIGKAEVLEHTECGRILKGLIDSGVRVGVSSRGSGQLNESTGRVRNFNLITVDAVATPSCRTAYPETIQEQLDSYRRGEIITDLAAEAINGDALAQEYFQIEMRRFIEELTKA